jgi:Tetracyclin repressor-like, C-terminal domain
MAHVPLAPLAGTTADAGDPDPGHLPLSDQIRAWAERTAMPDLPVRVLALGLLCWTRLHGVISLELGHHLASTGIDAALLYEAEVEALIDQAQAGAGSRRWRPGPTAGA